MIKFKADLTALAWTWVTSNQGALHNAQLDQAVVPDAIVARVTVHEPYRTQALADAKLWMGIPMLFGIGLEVTVLEPLVVEHFDRWLKSIYGVRINVNWAYDMSGQQTEGFKTRLARVGFEDGGWRIIQVMEDAERTAMRAQMQLVTQWLRLRNQ
ncbi:MAG: hypothetical protein R3C14_44195 [Caldilineaceae bacterium]